MSLVEIMLTLYFGIFICMPFYLFYRYLKG
jgi:hypothetical protein